MSVNISGLDFWTVGKCNTPVEDINYGALYNWYAATDVREITSVGWHIPTHTERDTLLTYLGGDLVAGGKLKEIGTTYWNSPNTGATNEVGFNGKGSGIRGGIGGSFSGFNTGAFYWFSDAYDANNAYYFSMSYSVERVWTGWVQPLTSGYSLRPIKDSTTLSHGETGTYTDPSGYIYRTICIGTQEWVVDNIKTEHYRTGDAIPVVTDNGDWAALITGAMCYYNNDISNA